jgi:hypothetical protein
MQSWRDVTLGGGRYISERNAQGWEWKAAFFGGDYERLLGVRWKYDTEGVFWAVGSDDWEIGDRDGGDRWLCRV